MNNAIDLILCRDGNKKQGISTFLADICRTAAVQQAKCQGNFRGLKCRGRYMLGVAKSRGR
jgi:hypothetical protein